MPKQLEKGVWRQTKGKKMSDVAKQLLQGSRNIDRMKSEIHETVSIILGLMKGSKEFISQFKDGRCAIGFSDSPLGMEEPILPGQCIWYISYCNHRICDELGRLDVECIIDYDRSKHMNQQTYGYTLIRGEKKFSIKNIEVVYDSLNGFVCDIFKRYPIIQEKCQPFLDAVEKFQS